MANKSLVIIFIAGVILFVGGVYHIFSLRFRAGDVYPHYSSLRSDPLGSKIFFESLSNIPGNTVMRDYNTFPTWEGGQDTTLFLLGIKTGIEYGFFKNPGEQNFKIISDLLSSGTRIVISLHPESLKLGPLSVKYKPDKEDEDKKDKKDEQNQDKKKEKEEKPDYSFFKRWGFQIDTVDNEEMLNAERAGNAGNYALPQSVKMYSYFYFKDLNDKWNAVYTINGNPVVITRKYGGGTIILCADSYFISNEAMVKDRYPGLLSWLVGPARKIYFDESHFGIQHNIGIIDLAYKYRLQGVLLSLILVAGLYIWKNVVSFIPPRENNAHQTSGIKAEKDHLDGLVSLLQRHVPADELVITCVREWEKSAVKDNAIGRPDLPSVDELESLAGLKGKPSLIYNSICKKLMERKRI